MPKQSVRKDVLRAVRAIAAGLLVVTVAASAAPALQTSFLPSQSASEAPPGAREICRSYEWACRAPAGGRITAEQVSLARQVNRRVNRQVREVSDKAQYGVAERWALPTRRGGDCEDFALLKKRELVMAGLPPERLLIASALDRRNAPHAVLILRTDGGDLVLDNLTDRIVGWRETGYTFLRMQDPSRPTVWVKVLAGGILG